MTWKNLPSCSVNSCPPGSVGPAPFHMWSMTDQSLLVGSNGGFAPNLINHHTECPVRRGLLHALQPHKARTRGLAPATTRDPIETLLTRKNRHRRDKDTEDAVSIISSTKIFYSVQNLIFLLHESSQTTTLLLKLVYEPD